MAMTEVRVFMGLARTFQERGWSSPKPIDVQGEISGEDLLAMLDLRREMVEVIFVNGKAHPPDDTIVRSGDRVALAPPGVPGPYRVLLGFKNMD